MRLSDVVNGLRRRFSEVRSFALNPAAFFQRRARRSAQNWYEKASVGGDAQKRQQRRPSENSPRSQMMNGRGRSPRSAQYQTIQAVAEKHPNSELVTWEITPEPSSGFAEMNPLLQEGEVLQGGWWGRYVVGPCRQDQGWMRLYEGVQENGNEPVWIYAYVLSETDYNNDEIKARYRAFKQLVNLNLKFGNDADFRIIRLKDVIVSFESGCYLITKPIQAGVPLEDYLTQRSQPLSVQEIYQFFYQVLQSLHYLYTNYRVRWLNDHSERRLCHGKLTMERLLIRELGQLNQTEENSFFIYLSRFALWEHLFDPTRPSTLDDSIATSAAEIGSVTDDLRCLGQIGAELLNWNAQFDTPDVFTHASISSAAISIQQLDLFVERLQGEQGSEPFKSFESALTQLRNLAQLDQSDDSLPTDVLESPLPVLAQQRSPNRWLKFSLITIGAAGSAMLLTYWLASRHLFGVEPLQVQEQDQRCIENCRFRDVEGWPTGAVRYAIEPYSSWTSAIAQSINPTQNVNALEITLTSRYRALSSLQIKGLPPQTRRQEIFQQLATGELDFALMEWSNDLPEALTSQVVAYDGIAIFVAFSDASRNRNVPKLLEGKINLQDLRALASGNETLLAESDVELYSPNNDLTIANFKQLLFQATGPQLQQFNSANFTDSTEPEASSDNELRDDVYEILLGKFESQGDEQVIRIGFDRFSRMFGQCAVYPLAIQVQSQTIHPFVESNGQPIDINTDLCGDKGGYWFNSQVFRPQGEPSTLAMQYPFKYPLVVVYPKCATANSQASCQAGQTFAKMLRTIEGQYLLSQMNLIPLISFEELNRNLWDNNDTTEP